MAHERPERVRGPASAIELERHPAPAEGRSGESLLDEARRLARFSDPQAEPSERTTGVPFDEDHVDREETHETRRRAANVEERLGRVEDHHVRPRRAVASGILPGKVGRVMGVLDDPHPQSPRDEPTHALFHDRRLAGPAPADDLDHHREVGVHPPRPPRGSVRPSRCRHVQSPRSAAGPGAGERRRRRTGARQSRPRAGLGRPARGSPTHPARVFPRNNTHIYTFSIGKVCGPAPEPNSLRRVC